MIFGKTRKELMMAEKYTLLEKYFSGNRKFALVPTRLSDGRLIWLGWYYTGVKVYWDDSAGTIEFYKTHDDSTMHTCVFKEPKFITDFYREKSYTKEEILAVLNFKYK